MNFDFHELDDLAADLITVPEKAMPNIRKAVQVSSRLAKDTWREIASGAVGSHATGYPPTISYETKETSDGVTGEIGPVPRGQGALGFLEEGVASQGTAGQNAIPVVVHEVTPDFIRGLLKAATDPLEA